MNIFPQKEGLSSHSVTPPHIEHEHRLLFGLPVRFQEFLCGLLISRLGDALYTFAIPWISYEMTRSALVMGSMYAVTVLPVVLFGPFVGVLVDGWDRRTLMILSDGARALLVAMIPLLHMVGQLHVWHLYAVSFTLAVFSLLFDVSTVASIPQLVNGTLTRANSMQQLVNQSANLIGPILAGFCISTLGGYNTLWLDVVSFGATLWSVSRLPAMREAPLQRSVSGALRSMKEGLLWIVKDRPNLALSLQAMVGNFGYCSASAVLMYYLLNTLKLNAAQSSYNFTMIGVGGLVGTMMISPLEKRLRRGVIIPSLLGIGAFGFLLPAVSTFWLMPGIAFAIVSICNVGWNTLAQTLRQETVPAELLGRVLAFSRILTRSAMPIGAMVGGMLSNAFSPTAVFIVAALAKGSEVLIALFSPIRSL